MLEILWLKTGKRIYADIMRHWTKIFAVSFGMGVVSGVVLSYQFGTNWSEFSRLGGNVIGPLMSYEVLTAFFLEAGFLGIMLFGHDRVPKAVHLFATAMVALGTLISAFWILSANSWMQTPAGYTVGPDGVLHVADWWQVIFNPSFPYRFAHMTAAAYLTTAFIVSGIGAWYILRGRSVAHGRIMLGMGLSLLVWLAPLQLVIGDLHGLNTREHQPAKIAALEAHWETQKGAPLILFAVPDPKEEKNHFEIAVPRLGSLILTHEWDGEIRGLKSFPPEDRPNPIIPFFAFRIMVGIGTIMIAVGIIGSILWLTGRLYSSRWFLQHARLGLAARLPRRARRLVHHRGRAPALDRVRRVAHGRRGVAGSRRQHPLFHPPVRARLRHRVRRRPLLHCQAREPRARRDASGPGGRRGRPLARPMAAAGNP